MPTAYAYGLTRRFISQRDHAPRRLRNPGGQFTAVPATSRPRWPDQTARPSKNRIVIPTAPTLGITFGGLGRGQYTTRIPHATRLSGTPAIGVHVLKPSAPPPSKCRPRPGKLPSHPGAVRRTPIASARSSPIPPPSFLDNQAPCSLVAAVLHSSIVVLPSSKCTGDLHPALAESRLVIGTSRS